MIPRHVDLETLEAMTPDERLKLRELLAAAKPPLWVPLPGPQCEAYESKADIVGYGGAAGGGKTDLAVGLALTQHKRIGIFRQNGTEIVGIVDRIASILGHREGYNGQDRIWRTLRRDGEAIQIEFGSFPAPDDERKYQGRPHDLLVFDEASNMREASVRFLLGWLRTTDPRQRCRALLTFNPPNDAEGRWVIQFFGPWIDKKHPKPAKPGELRWFAMIDGKDVEVDGPAEILHGTEKIRPTSRTFIPSRLTDNPYLLGTGYMATLQALPEPLRSQMLHGDFQAGMGDSAFQVIPTRWVEEAMQRWRKPERLAPMDSLGVDVAMGGKDMTVLARRHGAWFDEPIVYTGAQSLDGPTIAGFCVAAKRNDAVIHIDLFGVGSQPYGHLMAMQQQVVGVNVGEPAREVAKDGRIPFRNLRSQLWWKMREALEPAANTGIALPNSQELLADLTAPWWSMKGSVLQVASRDEIVEVTGRSPDYGTAYVLALMDTPKLRGLRIRASNREYDPYAGI